MSDLITSKSNKTLLVASIIILNNNNNLKHFFYFYFVNNDLYLNFTEFIETNLEHSTLYK